MRKVQQLGGCSDYAIIRRREAGVELSFVMAL